MENSNTAPEPEEWNYNFLAALEDMKIRNIVASMEGISRDVRDTPKNTLEENFEESNQCQRQNYKSVEQNSNNLSPSTNPLSLQSFYRSEYNGTPSCRSLFNDTPSVYSDTGTLITTSLPISISGSSRLPINSGSSGSLSSCDNDCFARDQSNGRESPQSTDPLLKNKWFINTLCENLSKMYAILLFMVGCVFYMIDILEVRGPALGEAFNVALIVVQLCWFGYIHIDVRRHINSVTSTLKESKVRNATEYFETEKQLQIETKQCESNQPRPQYYGFTSGRHGGSLYLKIGAALFCFGYLIHTGLNLAEKVIHYMSADIGNEYIQHIILSVLQPIYAFYQLFFIFKYSNLIINWRKRLSRFALMHCISSSLLFWVYTITQETLQEIFEVDSYDDYSNMTEKHSKEEKFNSEEEYNIIHKIHTVTPYLYPFSIEYNIFIVGFWILLWENIGKMERNTHHLLVMAEDESCKEATHPHGISVDCNKSNRGLFAGLLMTVGSATSVILLYVLSVDETTKDYGLIVNCYTELIFLVAMTVASVLAFMKISQLDVTKHAAGNIDNTLLYICLPFIFLYSVFSMIPAITNGMPSFAAVSLVQVLQPVIQTALISDGLRRCANSKELASKKPGRGLITFMIIANVAHWMLETFQLKFEDGNSHKYQFYGKETWTVLSHITLPVALFYRFHSSVCLVDIWKGGYEKESKH